MDPWLLWLITSIALLIAEIIVPGFILAVFSAGCAVAALIAVLTPNVASQFAGFAIGTLVAFFTIRPLMVNRSKAPSETLTNIEALKGLRGRVTETIDPASHTGRVLVRGDDWKAGSSDRSVIVAGEPIIVDRVDGITLLVSRISSTSTE